MTEYSVKDSVAIIQLDNPPVNALGSKVRSGIDKYIKEADRDSSVKAVVVCGKRGNFCAGADIKEFDGGKKGPWITDIGDYFDKMKKPVVAAIEGVALGGGLELALFCHYRIAVKSARVGQPEVAIGLIPGGGGTIRLPKAAGLKNALEIITTGNHVSAEKAHKMGIIDQIVSGNIIEEGIKFAKSKVHLDTSIVCLRNKHVKVDGDVDKVAEAAMAKVKSKYRGAMAPIYCVKSVMNSVRVPYQKGIELEHEYFQDLRSSSQSKAMRYAFFAERAITKWQLPSGGNYRTAKPLPVKTAGVIGAGTMGGGIALCLITSGIPCVLVEQNKEFLDKGMEAVKMQLMGTVRLGKMAENQAKQCMAILKPTVNFEDLKNVDLVIEAVFEDLKLKRDIFERLDKMCKPETILCTNTSTLDIDSIATATKRQEKVVGTHFFAPSYIMKLLENIYGTKTSAETVATVMKLGKTIRKVPVLVGSCTGFVANRMLGPYSQEAQYCVAEGASPGDVDNSLMDYGMPMGTFQVSDLSGVDVGFRIRREAARKAGETLTTKSRFFMGERNCSLIEALVEKGRLGKKVGKGWYKYDGPRGKPVVDPEVTQLIEEHCRSLGLERRTIGSQEILERMQYAMINEGFKILEEGLCTMPEEIDIIWIYGFSWPKYMGGPMYYASQIGLKKIYEKICYFHKTFPYSAHWVPSSLLAKLSKNDVPFNKWGQAVQGSKL
ncbi:peroxisomal bifunctional enzyme-like isoform X3 [Mercenaria mercenaria]|uniref:peroxisomal bifunctional enzyme-like isoform X3 n=1 Tax=Mercenaria mercenaria TaxID=6596 RepID=UPI00234F6B0A|nr:peroxisomal bifunctional enzyme-like isoform X3 [Mercenaria mercenaria]